jgi:hypothetical protein
MAADEEVCGPAIYGTGPHGRDLAREARDAHRDIDEIIRETRPLSARVGAVVGSARGYRATPGRPRLCPLACVCPACTHELNPVSDVARFSPAIPEPVEFGVEVGIAPCQFPPVSPAGGETAR